MGGGRNKAKGGFGNDIELKRVRVSVFGNDIELKRVRVRAEIDMELEGTEGVSGDRGGWSSVFGDEEKGSRQQPGHSNGGDEGRHWSSTKRKSHPWNLTADGEGEETKVKQRADDAGGRKPWREKGWEVVGFKQPRQLGEMGRKNGNDGGNGGRGRSVLVDGEG